MGAADRGEKIPVGWGLDKDGKDTTDPKAVETLLPLGGAKGAGLSFMIECLTSLFLSNPRLAPDLEDGSIENNPFLNGAAIAINVEAFGSRDMFEAEAARLVDADVLAREVVAADTEGLRAVVDRFGEEVLRTDGTLDRAKADWDRRAALGVVSATTSPERITARRGHSVETSSTMWVESSTTRPALISPSSR